MGMRAAAQPYKAPSILALCGLPIGTPSSGTIGDNGALSAITAFTTTYSDGVYLYFPAGKIFAGSLADHYYCVMSNTTTGTIYNNTYTSGIPAIPASLTPFVTTGPGAYTQALTEITTLSFPDIIPAGFMGINGGLRVRYSSSAMSTAGAKVIKHKLNTSNYFFLASTTAGFNTITIGLINKGRADRQFSTSWNQAGTSVDPNLYTSENTALACSLSSSLQLGVATDYVILNMFRVEVLPS